MIHYELETESLLKVGELGGGRGGEMTGVKYLNSIKLKLFSISSSV